ncbi:MAG: radical SAM protein [Candidatus Omnitrophota bacterium]|nr:radical SAM protein [Candidatus Omnitrophota bacterium]
MKNKKNIVLIHPPLSVEEKFGSSKNIVSHIHPPQGLCHLAAMFSEEEFNVSIIDSQALFIGLDETVKKVAELKPDYIGIITFTICMHTIARLHEMLKAVIPDVKIILGGPHINACPEETFKRYPMFEAGVLHEGEYTLPELIECYEKGGNLKDIKGIVFKDERGDITYTAPRPLIKNLDTLPMPRWDLLPHLPDYYRPSIMTYRALPAVAIVTSRGCPNRCTFCDRSVFGRVWRAHSVGTILSWVDHLVSKYGIKDINFQDDHFMVNKKRVIEICDGIKQKHPDLLWSTIGRADSVSADVVKIMKEAGCWQIALGIESGSQKILDILKKDVTVEQIENAVKTAKQFGITVKGLFMAGCPNETEETLRETHEFIKKIDLDYISMSAFTPIPNTDIYKEWHKYGRWEGAEPGDWDKLNLWEPIFIPHGLTKEYLKGFVKKAILKK